MISNKEVVFQRLGSAAKNSFCDTFSAYPRRMFSINMYGGWKCKYKNTLITVTYLNKLHKYLNSTQFVLESKIPTVLYGKRKGLQ